MESEEKKKSNTIVLTIAFARVIEPRKIQIRVRERRTVEASYTHERARLCLFEL